MRFDIAAQSIKGGRSYQEDTWTVRDLDGRDLAETAASASGASPRDGALVLVADGMGGEGGGGEASQIVAERFNATFFAETAPVEPRERLRVALEDANASLLAAKQGGAELKEKSGSTLIAGIVHDKGLHFLSVGDSSIWRFRDEEVHRINVLHERAPELDVRAAYLDTEQAWDHVLNDPQRHSITAAVMGFAFEGQQPQIATRAIQAGDVLIFASDGIETLSFEHLRRAVSAILAERNAAALATALIKMIERLGPRDQDNTTVIVVRALADDAGKTRMLPPGDAPRASVPPTQARPPSAAAAAPIPAAPARRAPRGPWGGATLGLLAAAALAATALAVIVGYILWPRPQEGPSEPSRRAGVGNAVPSAQTGPTAAPGSPSSSPSGPTGLSSPSGPSGPSPPGPSGQPSQRETGHNPGARVQRPRDHSEQVDRLDGAQHARSPPLTMQDCADIQSQLNEGAITRKDIAEDVAEFCIQHGY